MEGRELGFAGGQEGASAGGLGMLAHVKHSSQTVWRQEEVSRSPVTVTCWGSSIALFLMLQLGASMVSILWIRKAGCREAKFEVTSKQHCVSPCSAQPSSLQTPPLCNFCPPTVLEGLIEIPTLTDEETNLGSNLFPLNVVLFPAAQVTTVWVLAFQY